MVIEVEVTKSKYVAPPEDQILKVNEIFESICGEGSYTGFRFVLVRLTGCNLSCSYCDTKYAFTEGKEMKVSDIVKEVEKYQCGIVEISGGEPFEQDINTLVQELKNKHVVLIETNGSKDLSDELFRFFQIKLIMDWKLPSSGMNDKMLFKNLEVLTEKDDIKFVISDRKDYDEAMKIIDLSNLRCNIFLSPVFGKIQPSEIVGWMKKSKLNNVRLQLQLHKIIYPVEQRGV